MRTRSFLYKVARLMGDINSIFKGTPHKRYARKKAHTWSGKNINKLFK